MPILVGLYTPKDPYYIPLTQKINNVLAIGLIALLVFPGIVEFNNHRWCKEVDKNVPRLLRDVSEAVHSGLSLPKALEEASQRDYGPISKELERAISMFILGESWQDVLMVLAKRLKQPSVLRLSTIFIETHQMGGKVNEVLDTSVNLFTSINEFREEQYNNTRPHIMTVYFAMFLFFIVSRIILDQFLAPLGQVSETELTGSNFLVAVLDIEYYTSIFFWASNLESFFGGLIAGMMGERSLSAGLFHSVILMIITLIFFNFRI
jgi:flagellar protein FlaJ